MTYSKAAVLNIEERLAGFNINYVRCSTTHALGLSIIMEHWTEVGFTAKPKVEIKQLGRKLAFIVKKFAAMNKVDAKKLGVAVKMAIINGNNRGQIREGKRISMSVVQVLKRYKNIKLRKNLLDYTDMLNLSTQLLKSRTDIRKKVGINIEHLLVDEVQDMNMKECQFIFYLADQAKSAVFVGDKKQSIYGFRGANPECLLKLEKHLNPTVFHLTKSFRVPTQMLPLVNAIGAAINDDPKLTSNRQGFKPCIFRSANNDEQAEFVVREIKKLLGKGVPANEIAVLGRTKRTLIVLKNALNMSGIKSVENYCTSKEEPLKILKALILIVRWEAMALKRGKHPFKPVKALKCLLENSGLPEKIQQELHRAICKEGWGRLYVPKKQGETCYRNILALRTAVEKAAKLPPESGVQLLIDAIKPLLGSRFGKAEKPIVVRDFSAVKLAMRGYKTWSDVRVKKLPVTYSGSGVDLATCHDAKGREWQYVFLSNFIDGEFPFYFKKEDVKLEEERRLFYVAASRPSKQLLVIASPVYKNNYGRGRQKFHTNLKSESTFIADYGAKLKVVK